MNTRIIFLGLAAMRAHLKQSRSLCWTEPYGSAWNHALYTAVNAHTYYVYINAIIFNEPFTCGMRGWFPSGWSNLSGWTRCKPVVTIWRSVFMRSETYLNKLLSDKANPRWLTDARYSGRASVNSWHLPACSRGVGGLPYVYHRLIVGGPC